MILGVCSFCWSKLSKKVLRSELRRKEYEELRQELLSRLAARFRVVSGWLLRSSDLGPFSRGSQLDRLGMVRVAEGGGLRGRGNLNVGHLSVAAESLDSHAVVRHRHVVLNADGLQVLWLRLRGREGALTRLRLDRDAVLSVDFPDLGLMGFYLAQASPLS